MDIIQYNDSYRSAAIAEGLSKEEIKQNLTYANHLQSQGLPVIFDQVHFCLLVGYDYGYILGLSNSPESHYKHYEIPKRNGGSRNIEEPYPSLKEIQTWILQNILMPAARKYVHPVAKAFVPNTSIRDNARFHRNKKHVLALDIHDFFGSIHSGAVFGVFNSMGYSISVSTLLMKLCTFHDSLPQGAPTSPMLSNMVFACADKKIFDYCRVRNIIYTRYADDMVFSSNSIEPNHLIAYVANRVNNLGMLINEDKTKVMGRGMRQNVTGVVVNDKLQVPRKYRDKIRQEIFYSQKYGLEQHMQRVNGLPASITKIEHYVRHLYGRINYVLQINPKDKEFLLYKEIIKGQYREML